jgi:heme/copper-type cytochrome/quinol oxidase subunit 3
VDDIKATLFSFLAFPDVFVQKKKRRARWGEREREREKKKNQNKSVTLWLPYYHYRRPENRIEINMFWFIFGSQLFFLIFLLAFATKRDVSGF